jgi:hypothetical protein
VVNCASLDYLHRISLAGRKGKVETEWEEDQAYQLEYNNRRSGNAMSTPTVEIGGSHEKLAEVLLTSDQTVTLTSDGQPVGTFIPAHRKTKEEAWASYERHHDALQAQMAALGLTEEDMMAEYWRLRAEEKARGGA